MKKFIIAILLGMFFVFGCIGGNGTKACESDGDCRSYEECNLETNTCELKSGYCSYDEDCNDELKECDRDTRECVYKEGRCRFDGDCEGWQVCDAEGYCKAGVGYC